MKRLKKIDLELVRTCETCPEQYDVYTILDGKRMQIAYIRLRWSCLRVQAPDCCVLDGEDNIILDDDYDPSGAYMTGNFLDCDREIKLDEIRELICRYYNTFIKRRKRWRAVKLLYKNTMEIIKPYNWNYGSVYGYTKEQTVRAWDSVWEFINHIDIMADFKEFSSSHKDYDLEDFRDYLDAKYEYHDELGDTLFNMIDIDEFIEYLSKKYPSFNYHIQVIERYLFEFKES